MLIIDCQAYKKCMSLIIQLSLTYQKENHGLGLLESLLNFKLKHGSMPSWKQEKHKKKD